MHRRIENIRYAIITVSDSRYKNLIEGKEVDDKSGEFLKKELNANIKIIIPDDKNMIIGAINFLIDNYDVDAIVLTGGTGIDKKDVTVEALKEIIEKEIEGFKIIFQILSYEEVGFRCLLSRAFAGIYRKKVIFSLPGSINACKVGVKIIKEECGHILGHIL